MKIEKQFDREQLDEIFEKCGPKEISPAIIAVEMRILGQIANECRQELSNREAKNRQSYYHL